MMMATVITSGIRSDVTASAIISAVITSGIRSDVTASAAIMGTGIPPALRVRPG
jgi:hypothetical protein